MGQNDVGESERPSSSDVGQSFALSNMTEEDIKSMVTNHVRQIVKPIVITIVQQSIERIAEDVLRRVIKEEVQSFRKKGLAGESRNDVPNLYMRFVDEVSGPVMTSNELQGIRGDPLEVALYDATGHIVNSGPESSAKVEIVLIDASDDDDENIITREKFESRIIKAGDKKKPYLSGNVYISLKRGAGSLNGLKLGHGKDWTNFCNCRLGVRLVQNFKGVTAQEGWTKPFKVIDKRGKQYDKHYPPFPSDDVWRLKKIARNGEPCNRLYEKNIKTVEDFMFWHNVNHEELQQKILRVGDSAWKTIVDHACTCTMDKEKMYSHKCPEAQMSVIYDGVGKLKGVIYKSHFTPTDDLSADIKDYAHKLLSSVLDPSAFVKRYNTPFNDEEFHQQHQSDINASAICSIHPCSNHNDLTRSEYINLLQPTGPGSTSQSSIPNSNSYSGPSDSLGPRDTGGLCDPPSALFENIDGDSPTDLDNENHCFLKSPLLEKHKAGAQELSPPFNDMNYLHQVLIASGPLDSLQPDCLGSRTSEMVGECSNASFHSVSSTMNSFETGGYWCGDDNNDDQWGIRIRDDFPPGPPSPNPMYSCNEPHADQGSTATADEPQPANTSTDPPNRLSRLWVSFKKTMSLDGTRTHKKQKVG